MGTKKTAWFVGGAIALAGCTTGFLLGFWAGTANVLERVPSGGGADLREIGSALEEVQRSNEEVLRRVSDRGRSSSGTSASSAVTDERLQSLTAAMQGLGERIDADRRLRKGPGFRGIEAVRTESDLRAAHAFWTRDDLAQRYGSPAWVRSSLDASGSFDHLSYPLGSPPAYWLDFVVSEDQVIDVLVTDSGLPPR